MELRKVVNAGYFKGKGEEDKPAGCELLPPNMAREIIKASVNIESEDVPAMLISQYAEIVSIQGAE
jgi:hypothetical protein